MSYAVHARRVRDEALSLRVRRSALGSCVVRYAPYGYRGTLAFLQEHCGRLDTAAGLIGAIDQLDASRAFWLTEVAAFAVRRGTAKAAGRRRPATAELAAFAAMGWPGGGPDGPTLSPRFLRQFGLVASAPGPVRLRRRIRWRDRRLAEPVVTSRIEWGNFVFVVVATPVLAGCCGGGFWLFDHLAAGLWLAGGLVALLALVALLVGIADNPRRTDAALRVRLTAERDALRRRLDAAERTPGAATE